MIKNYYEGIEDLIYLNYISLNTIRAGWNDNLIGFNFKDYYIHAKQYNKTYKVTSEKLDCGYIKILFNDYIINDKDFHIILYMDESQFENVEDYYFDSIKRKRRAEDRIIETICSLTFIIQGREFSINQELWRYKFLRYKGIIK